ncbi:MAG: hypothetical protein PF444_01500, partial [Bacteroidales bacterium]|nr:hypothetical protein [Bacteroidales bacterium]
MINRGFLPDCNFVSPFFRLFIFSLLALLSTTASAQKFKHITTSDGLPDSHVRCFYQSKSGYMCLGTRTSFCQYDGYDFKTIEVDDPTNPVPREYSAIIEDDEGNFHIVASTGIYFYNSAQKVIVNAKRLQLFDEACFIQYHSKLYCGNSEGLFIYAGDKTWGRIILGGVDFSEYHIRVMKENSQGDLMIGTNKGLFVVSNDDKTVHHYRYNNPHFDNVNGLLADAEGGVWISTSNNLYYMDKERQIKKDYASFLEEKILRCMCLDQSGRIWVGGQFGIKIIDTVNDEVEVVIRTLNDVDGLNDDAVYSLYSDQSGNVWVGTYYGGINLWNASYDYFKIYRRGKDDNNISGNVVRQMIEDDEGNLWLALEDGGLNYLDRKTNRCYHYFTDYKNGFYNVHSLLLDKGDLWISTFERGVIKYRIEKGKGAKPLLVQQKKCLTDKINFVISKDAQGMIWAGTNEGIYQINSATCEVNAYRSNLFKNVMVTTMCWANADEALVGTLRNGLFYFNKAKHTTVSFSDHPQFKPMYTIANITTINDSIMAIATSDGLYLYDKQENLLWNELPFSATNETRALMSDQDGLLWISTINGLLSYDLESEQINHYSKDDGLPDVQFNYNSSFMTQDGELFFGTYKGLISFFPNNMPKKEEVLSVRCLKYSALDKSKETFKDFELSENSSKLTLEPYQSLLTLSFSTFEFSHSGSINYSIKMGEKGWESLKGNHSITFANLASGKHVLLVKADTKDFHSNILKIHIKKKPPLVRSVFAYIMYGVLVILLYFYLRRRTLLKVKEKNVLDFERYERKKMQEMSRQQLQFFLNISHEFRTPITIVKGVVENLLRKSKLDKEVLEKVRVLDRNANNMNNLVHDFLEYGKLESGY